MRHTASCPSDALLTADSMDLYIHNEASTCVDSGMHFAKQTKSGIWSEENKETIQMER